MGSRKLRMKGLKCGNGGPDERDGEREVGPVRGTGGRGEC
jgi:hypothetical protein